MNLTAVLALLLTQFCAVGGQVFMKLAVTPGPRLHWGAPRGFTFMAAAIALLTVRFFVWLGLMARFDLSYIYPFEAVEPLLLVLAAAVFLREKMSPRLWAGVFLITAGVGLVSLTDATTAALDRHASVIENEAALLPVLP